MRTFSVQVVLPNYSPEQALQMHMDETFQASAAEACNAHRRLEVPGFVNGNAYERWAIFDSQGEAPQSILQRWVRSATPHVQYREISRYFAPPCGTVDIQVLAPAVASDCVMVHVDLMFDPFEGGTVRTLQGQVEVAGSWWVPSLVCGAAEYAIASQLEQRLGQGAAFAASWAASHPNYYSNALRPQPAHLVQATDVDRTQASAPLRAAPDHDLPLAASAA